MLSDEHFTVDGTLVQAWASMKSFVPREDMPPEQGAPSAAVRAAAKDCPGGPASKQREQKVKASPQQSAPEAPAAEPDKSHDTAAMQPPDSEKKSRNEEVDFHGQKRSNATHASTTDPEARLLRKGKGKEARLCFMGHATTENRHGLVVETAMTHLHGEIRGRVW